MSGEKEWHPERPPFVPRPRKGRTERKRRLPGRGKRTNVGDPAKR